MNLLALKKDTKSLKEDLKNVSSETELNQLLIRSEILFFSLSENYPSLHEIKEIKDNYSSISNPLKTISNRLTFLLDEFGKLIERRMSLE
jgi:hypothetical protein